MRSEKRHKNPDVRIGMAKMRTSGKLAVLARDSLNQDCDLTAASHAAMRSSVLSASFVSSMASPRR